MFRSIRALIAASTYYQGIVQNYKYGAHLTQILVIGKLNGKKDLVLRDCVYYDMVFPSKQLSLQS